ncbi:MAG: hypothetical protein IKV94_01270 [Clostridia bacterium]|nr:hypothetical protein [Clostridia bacterium]
MKVNRIFIILIVLPLLLNNVFATDDYTKEIAGELELEKVVDKLNDFTEDIDLEEISSNILTGKGLNFGVIGNILVKSLKENISPFIKEAVTVIIFLILFSFIRSFELERDSCLGEIVNIVGVLVIVSIYFARYINLLDIMKEAISLETNIVQIISPFMMGILILTGAVTTTSLIQPIVLLLVGVIGFLVTYIIIPLISLSIVLNILSNLSNFVNMERFSKMANKAAMLIVTILLTAFVTLYGLQTSISTSVDEVTLKASQAAVSNTIPVVGKFVSDSLEFIIGASQLIGKTGGIIALIVIIVLLISPVIKLAIATCITTAVSAIAEALNLDNKIVKIIEGFSNSYKTILGILIAISIMFITSIGVVISLMEKIAS